MSLTGLAWSWDYDNPLEVSYDNQNVTSEQIEEWLFEQKITDYEFTISSHYGVRVRFTDSQHAIMFKLAWGDSAWRNRIITGV